MELATQNMIHLIYFSGVGVSAYVCVILRVWKQYIRGGWI